jgi:hypothetical protein
MIQKVIIMYDSLLVTAVYEKNEEYQNASNQFKCRPAAQRGYQDESIPKKKKLQ